jgi:hypothetical protein
VFFNLSLESHSASHGDSPSEKKGSPQFIDGKPVVPPKPGKPTTPQATAKPQVNQFLSSIKLFFSYSLVGQYTNINNRRNT